MLAVGCGYLLRDVCQSFTYEGAAPAEPVGPPSLHLSAFRAFSMGFQFSITACFVPMRGLFACHELSPWTHTVMKQPASPHHALEASFSSLLKYFPILSGLYGH